MSRRNLMPRGLPILHVPRRHNQLTADLAASGYWLVYCTDYPLTEEQGIELAVAKLTVEEDEIILNQLLALANAPD